MSWLRECINSRFFKLAQTTPVQQIDPSRVQEFISVNTELEGYEQQWVLFSDSGKVPANAAQRIFGQAIWQMAEADANLMGKLAKDALTGTEPSIDVSYNPREHLLAVFYNGETIGQGVYQFTEFVLAQGVKPKAFSEIARAVPGGQTGTTRAPNARDRKKEERRRQLRETHPRINELEEQLQSNPQQAFEWVKHYANTLGYLTANTTITVQVPRQRQTTMIDGRPRNQNELRALFEQTYDQMYARLEELYPTSNKSNYRLWAGQRAFEAMYTKRDVSHSVAIRLSPEFGVDQLQGVLAETRRAPVEEEDTGGEDIKMSGNVAVFTSEDAYIAFRDYMNLSEADMPVYEFNRNFELSDEDKDQLRGMDYIKFPDDPDIRFTLADKEEKILASLLKSVPDEQKDYAEIFFYYGMEGNTNLSAIEGPTEPQMA